MAADDRLYDRYDDSVVIVSEMIFGAGHMSPGGPDGVRAIVEGLDLAGKTVLDIGCAIGGIDVQLATEFDCRVVGVDIEPGLIDIGRARIAAAGLADRVDLRLVEPGPLPFDDAAFDVVFGKDSWLLIDDKPAFFAELHRVLRPGGSIAASEWMGDGAPPSADMQAYFELRGMAYHLETAASYEAMLRAAGFTDVTVADTSDVRREQPRACCDAMAGPLRAPIIAAIGAARHEGFLTQWRALAGLFEAGELRAGQLRGAKPNERAA